MQALDQNIHKPLPVGETCARIRALWTKCNTLRTSQTIPAAQTFPPTPMATPALAPFNPSSGWHESLPPKLSLDDMEPMKSRFAKDCPGEILDADSTPSVRLWSLVHQQKVNKHMKHVPIQLRLSEHQYCALIQTRSSKPLRSEIQFLSQQCWDDIPEMDINSVRFSRDWHTRIPTVVRNAYALCNRCHLQALKTSDSKIAEYTFPHLDSGVGIKTRDGHRIHRGGQKDMGSCLPAPCQSAKNKEDFH